MARAMKDSGIEWIGEIPEDWEVLPHKYLMHKVKEICVHYNGESVISLSMQGVRIRDLNAGGKMPTTFDGYQYVEKENLLLCLFDIDVTPRCVGIVKDFGVTSPAYSRFVVHDGSLNRYYDYLLRFIDDEKVFVHLSKNLRSSLTETDFGSIKTIAPKLAEQRRIADFLDRRCAEIDGVIEATKKAIDEYKALKQSIITEAVTGQCAIGNVQGAMGGKRRMKDSGIEWIGEIPEEWEVSRVGLHFEIILGKMLCSEQQTNEQSLEKYFCAANVHFEGISDMNILKEMWFSPAEKQLYAVKNGDLLVVEGGAGAGGSAIVCGLIETAYVQNSIMIVRAKDQQDNRYLRYLLEYLVKQGYIDVVCNKATIPHFTKDKLANVPYPVMSSEEQTMIADYLDRNCLGIDQIVVAKQTLLSELETYKKSVIYEYVTGKREVK